MAITKKLKLQLTDRLFGTRNVPEVNSSAPSNTNTKHSANLTELASDLLRSKGQSGTNAAKSCDNMPSELELFLYLQNKLQKELAEIGQNSALKKTHTGQVSGAGKMVSTNSKTCEKFDEQIHTINQSGLFDKDYYLSRYPDVRNAKVDPLEHYVRHGASEKRVPHLLFDVEYYLSQTTVPAGISPLFHYLKHGSKKGAKPNPLFWDDYYRQELARIDIHDAPSRCDEFSPLGYYLKEGHKLPVPTHPLFDPAYYQEQAALHGGMKHPIPLIDYNTALYQRTVSSHPLFSPEFYLKQNPDVRQQPVNPLIHYLKHGWMEERSPHPLFNTKLYLQLYPRTTASKLDPLTYYLVTGWKEGHWANLAFDSNYYCETYPEDVRIHTNPLADYVMQGEAHNHSTCFFFSPEFYRHHANLSDTESPLEHFLSVGSKIGLEGSNTVPTNMYYTTDMHGNLTLQSDLPHRARSIQGCVLRGSAFRGHVIHEHAETGMPNDRSLHHAHLSIQRPRLAAQGESNTAMLGKDVQDNKMLDLPIWHKANKEPWRVAWYLPNPIEGSGGHRTILECANALSERGVVSDVYVDIHTSPDSTQLTRMMDGWFGKFKLNYHPHVNFPDDYDAYFATLWSSPELLLSQGIPKEKCIYLVQDYEPWFNPMSEAYLQAERSYQLGFKPVTIGYWLPEQLKRNFGITAYGFPFGAEETKYYRRPEVTRDKTVSFIYQPTKYRRCAQLGLQALKIVKETMPEANIYLYGSRDHSTNANFSHTNLGLLEEDDCNLLYNMSTVGICFSSSNPSRIPFEMMATGLPVIELDRDNTHYDYPQHGVVLADFDPKDIAMRIIALLTDKELWEKHSISALEFMKGRTRENERECFSRIVSRHLKTMYPHHFTDLEASEPSSSSRRNIEVGNF